MTSKKNQNQPVDRDAIYESIQQMYANKRIYKPAHQQLRNKLKPLNYRQVAKLHGVSHETVRQVRDEYEGRQNNTNRKHTIKKEQ